MVSHSGPVMLPPPITPPRVELNRQSVASQEYNGTTFPWHQDIVYTNRKVFGNREFRTNQRKYYRIIIL